MAAAIRPAVPAGPRHPVWVRMQPGATGCESQSRRTGTPRTPATAHSTWGRNAGGHECTKSTPRAVTADLRRLSRIGFPPGPEPSDGRVTHAPPPIVPHQSHPYHPFPGLADPTIGADCPI